MGASGGVWCGVSIFWGALFGRYHMHEMVGLGGEAGRGNEVLRNAVVNERKMWGM